VQKFPQKILCRKMFIFFMNLTIHNYVSSYSKSFIHYHIACWSLRLYTSPIYLYRMSTVGKIAILHRHQCRTCGIICECESSLDCNPSIFMSYICVAEIIGMHERAGSTSMRIALLLNLNPLHWNFNLTTNKLRSCSK
jgi:hypothetical protein